MLSKSLGQVLRIATCPHILFMLEDLHIAQETIEISEAAIAAAINFIEVCCQHAAFIAGRGDITEDLSWLMLVSC